MAIPGSGRLLVASLSVTNQSGTPDRDADEFWQRPGGDKGPASADASANGAQASSPKTTSGPKPGGNSPEATGGNPTGTAGSPEATGGSPAGAGGSGGPEKADTSSTPIRAKAGTAIPGVFTPSATAPSPTFGIASEPATPAPTTSSADARRAARIRRRTGSVPGYAGPPQTAPPPVGWRPQFFVQPAPPRELPAQDHAGLDAVERSARTLTYGVGMVAGAVLLIVMCALCSRVLF
jgi:hypothetical protein